MSRCVDLLPCTLAYVTRRSCEEPCPLAGVRQAPEAIVAHMADVRQLKCAQAMLVVAGGLSISQVARKFQSVREAGLTVSGRVEGRMPAV